MCKGYRYHDEYGDDHVLTASEGVELLKKKCEKATSEGRRNIHDKMDISKYEIVARQESKDHEFLIKGRDAPIYKLIDGTIVDFKDGIPEWFKNNPESNCIGTRVFIHLEKLAALWPLDVTAVEHHVLTETGEAADMAVAGDLVVSDPSA
jgi:hypothetical protein